MPSEFVIDEPPQIIGPATNVDIAETVEDEYDGVPRTRSAVAVNAFSLYFCSAPSH